MSARSKTTFDVQPASIGSTAPVTGRAVVVGTAGEGPGNTPTLVRGMAQYRQVFGQRTGGVDMHDALEQAFSFGLAEAVVVRGVGSTAVCADGDIDDLTVTALYPGAAANAWTATLSKPTGQVKLVVDGPGVSETWVAATGAALIASVNANSPKVRLSGAVGDAGAVTLTGGTAADGSVSVADMLALTTDFGEGLAVLTPGRHTEAVWEAVAAHCQATDRLGLLTMAAASTKDAALTARATISAMDGADATVLLWPRWDVDGVKVALDGPVAGLRAKAHADHGPHRSLLAVSSGSLGYGRPEFDVTDEDFWALDEAGVSVLRTVASRCRIYGWKLCRPLGDNPNLDGGQHRDTLNAIVRGLNEVGERSSGEDFDGRGLHLEAVAGAASAVLQTFTERGGIYPWIVDGVQTDPGWVIDAGPGVNSPEDIASGHVQIAVGVRLSSIFEMTTFRIGVGDAASRIA